MVKPAYASVLDDYGDVPPANLCHVGAVAMPALDHADRIAVAILAGDRCMPGAELSDANNIVVTALIGVGKVVRPFLTNHSLIVGTFLRID